MEFLHLVLLSVSVVFHVPVQGFVEVQKNKKNKKACKIIGGGLGYCFQKGGQIVWLHFAFYNFRLCLMILEVGKNKV